LFASYTAFIIIIFLLHLALDSQWLRNYLKNCKTLGASRLVPKILLLLGVLYSIRLFVHYFTISDKLTTPLKILTNRPLAMTNNGPLGDVGLRSIDLPYLLYAPERNVFNECWLFISSTSSAPEFMRNGFLTDVCGQVDCWFATLGTSENRSPVYTGFDRLSEFSWNWRCNVPLPPRLGSCPLLFVLLLMFLPIDACIRSASTKVLTVRWPLLVTVGYHAFPICSY